MSWTSDRNICAVPMDEVQKHFALNERQDIKVLVARALDGSLLRKLIARQKPVKPEIPLTSETWCHSPPLLPNQVWESRELSDDELFKSCQGPFTVAFANERAGQSAHYHKKHFELYYSEAPLRATYRHYNDDRPREVPLPNGGMILFYPMVVHRVWLSGMTVIIECPAVEDDRFECALDGN